ncbi:methyltransferase [Allosphingosinicella deserti]|uniref:Uncharacterized protein n=1 Tax=Allosphingosinicella deserti TaxID=2116704 RepID=A0A2P7QIW6_9SPHN|nr:methyltransferase [Sphingomonas deserti]PSJ37918.1 hypothetical protein C7I55_19600 [Sphingomonas deserti]
MTDQDSSPQDDAVAEAALRVVEIAGGHYAARALHLVVDLGLADMIADGRLSCVEIAAASAMDERAMLRILRLLAVHGVFVEPAERVFALGALGQALRAGRKHGAAAAVRMLSRSGMWEAAGNLGESLRTGQPMLESRRQRPLYQANSFARAEALAAAMAGFHAGMHAGVAAGYDFSNAGLVVDIGGSTGLLLEAILRAHPHLRGLLFDRPPTAPVAKERLEAVGLGDRCGVLGGDFFQSVPAGGDIYLLAHVIHDWPESDAVRILTNCRRVLASEARLLIVEPVSGDSVAELHATLIDAILMSATGGGCRTLQEHSALLAQAGLALRTVSPIGRIASLMEVVAAD